jgi:DNA polymerase-3 subunit delta'
MWSLMGHSAVLQLLTRSLQTNRLAHSYLLVGPSHVGKMTLALELAQAVNCIESQKPCGECPQCVRIMSGKHTDVQILSIDESDATTKEISIDQVRELQRSASLKPFEGDCRVFIADGAERLSQEATNALLKTLEEPPAQVLLLLLTTNEESLLPTLRSRCQRLELHPLSLERVEHTLIDRGASMEYARQLAVQSQGCLGIALTALQNPDSFKAEEQEIERLLGILKSSIHERFSYSAALADAFMKDRDSGGTCLRIWIAWWRTVLLAKEGLGHSFYKDYRNQIEDLAKHTDIATVVYVLRLIQETVTILDQNASPRLAFENLLLRLPVHAHGEY